MSNPKLETMAQNLPAVRNLLRDIENEIWEFQSETDEEDKAIANGLRQIIDRLEHHALQPKP